MEKPTWFSLDNYSYLRTASLSVWQSEIEKRVFRDNCPPDGEWRGKANPVWLTLYRYEDSFACSQKSWAKDNKSSSDRYEKYELGFIQRCIDDLNTGVKNLDLYDKQNYRYKDSAKQFDDDEGGGIPFYQPEELLQVTLDELGRREVRSPPNPITDEELEEHFKIDSTRHYLQFELIDNYLREKNSPLLVLTGRDELLDDREDHQLLQDIPSPTLDFFLRKAIAWEIEDLMIRWESCDKTADQLYREKLDKLREKNTLEDIKACDLISSLDYAQRIKITTFIKKSGWGWFGSLLDDWAGEAVEELRESTVLLRVNLDSPDDVLLDSFRSWLSEKRKDHPLPLKNRGHNSRSEITKPMVASWYMKQLIPLWDALLVRRFVNMFFPQEKVTNLDIANWLELGDYIDPAGEISKRIKKLDELKLLLPQIQAQAIYGAR